MSSAINNAINNNLINVFINFILFESISETFDGYIGKQLFCYIKQNDYLRTMFLILVVFFTLNEILTDNNELSIPDSLLVTFITVLVLLIFSRQDVEFNIVQIIFVLTIYIISIYKERTRDDSLEQKLTYTVDGLYITLLVIMLVGYYFYFERKVVEKGDRFSWRKFFIGSRESDSCRLITPFGKRVELKEAKLKK